MFVVYCLVLYVVGDAGGCGDLWTCRCFGCEPLLVSLRCAAEVAFGGFGLEVVGFCVSFSVFVVG